jgi:hypothetical protein
MNGTSSDKATVLLLSENSYLNFSRLFASEWLLFRDPGERRFPFLLLCAKRIGMLVSKGNDSVCRRDMVAGFFSERVA